MNISDLKKQFKKISDLKKDRNFSNFTFEELQKLPKFNGLCELSFNQLPFYMINISNDDAAPLKYLWRNKNEHISLNIWYEITRKDGVFFDVGAHTGIYSIIGNLNKKQNNIISIEPYYLNFSRLLSNLKINNIFTKNCFLATASNTEGVDKFKVNVSSHFHSSGGKITKIDKFNTNLKRIEGSNCYATINLNFSTQHNICDSL